MASLEQFAPPPPPTEASDGTVDTSLSRKLAEKYLSGLKDELDAKKDEEEKLFTSDEKQLEDKEDDSFALRVRKNTQERPIRYLTHEAHINSYIAYSYFLILGVGVRDSPRTGPFGQSAARKACAGQVARHI